MPTLRRCRRRSPSQGLLPSDPARSSRAESRIRRTTNPKFRKPIACSSFSDQRCLVAAIREILAAILDGGPVAAFSGPRAGAGSGTDPARLPRSGFLLGPEEPGRGRATRWRDHRRAIGSGDPRKIPDRQATTTASKLRFPRLQNGDCVVYPRSYQDADRACTRAVHR